MGEPRKKYYAACSFGKDSLATILLALDHGEPLDAAIYVEVMFDNERNISGDDVKQIEWIDNYAAPKIERMGCPVIKLRSKVDYVSFFHTPIVRGRHKGLIHGFPYSAHCPLQRECKLKPQRDFLRGQDYVQYVGIAAEETKRLNALDGINRISLLAKYGYTEAMAMELCRKHDLVSPIYKLKNRGGAGSAPIKELEASISCVRNIPNYGRNLSNLTAQCHTNLGQENVYVGRIILMMYLLNVTKWKRSYMKAVN